MVSYQSVEKFLKLWKSLGKEKIRLRKTKHLRVFYALCIKTVMVTGHPCWAVSARQPAGLTKPLAGYTHGSQGGIRGSALGRKIVLLHRQGAAVLLIEGTFDRINVSKALRPALGEAEFKPTGKFRDA